MSADTDTYIRKRDMKLDTFIIMSKGVAYVLTGFFAPWSAALAQWVNSGDWPPRIAWVVLVTVSIGSGASAWLAFCSGSWQEYHQQKKANDTGTAQVVTTQPSNAPGKP